MAWNNNQITDWFVNQMGLPNAMIAGLNGMGIAHPQDLSDYDEELLKQLKEDLKKPPGTIPDPNWVAPPQAPVQQGQPAPPAPVAPHIPRPLYVISPISLKRLIVAADLVRYYEIVGRNLTTASLRWTGPVMHYQQYMQARDKHKEDDEPEIPRISRSLGITLWVDAFELYLEKIYGCRDIPLAYVIRADENPPPLDAQQNNRPYGAEAGSVERELILRASHNHTMFTHDNQRVYELLEEALRTTAYSSTMSGFKRTKDGRGVWLAILSQHVGRDKWESEAEKQGRFIRSFKWKGTSNMTLESFVNKHRIAHTRMVRCSQNITLQTMTERERVGHLLDGIHTSDQALQAAIAQVKADDTDPTGKRSNFEDAAAYLIPFDPTKKSGGNKRNYTEIAAVKTDLPATKGKTGVEIRFYKKKDYDKLSNEQKEELREIHKNNKKLKADKDKKKSEVAAVSLSSKQRKELAKEASKQIIAAIAAIDSDDSDSESVKEIETMIAAVHQDKDADPKEAAKKIKAVAKEKGITLKRLKSIFKRSSDKSGGHS